MLHKVGWKYQHDWLYLHSMKSIRYQKRRYLACRVWCLYIYLVHVGDQCKVVIAGWPLPSARSSLLDCHCPVQSRLCWSHCPVQSRLCWIATVQCKVVCAGLPLPSAKSSLLDCYCPVQSPVCWLATAQCRVVFAGLSLESDGNWGDGDGMQQHPPPPSLEYTNTSPPVLVVFVTNGAKMT
jgi:hypothetical protein